MARVAHVRINATVCAICPAAVFDCLVHLNVGNNQVISIQSLNLTSSAHDASHTPYLSIAGCILQQIQQVQAALLGPASLGGAVCLSLSVATNAASKAAERHCLFVRNNILKELLCLLQAHMADCSSSLTSILPISLINPKYCIP